MTKRDVTRSFQRVVSDFGKIFPKLREETKAEKEELNRGEKEGPSNS